MSIQASSDGSYASQYGLTAAGDYQVSLWELSANLHDTEKMVSLCQLSLNLRKMWKEKHDGGLYRNKPYLRIMLFVYVTVCILKARHAKLDCRALH